MDEINKEEVLMRRKQLEEVTIEFHQYREMNDLDKYFAKNLSEETRQRVLENVEALMKVTDW